jgi:hypothetical protein
MRTEVSVQYEFSHDRVRQAAYSLVTSGEKPQLHLRIGRLMLGQLILPPDFDRVCTIPDDELVTETDEQHPKNDQSTTPSLTTTFASPTATMGGSSGTAATTSSGSGSTSISNSSSSSNSTSGKTPNSQLRVLSSQQRASDVSISGWTSAVQASSPASSTFRVSDANNISGGGSLSASSSDGLEQHPPLPSESDVPSYNNDTTALMDVIRHLNR